MKVYSTAKADLLSPKDAFALLGEPEVATKWGVPPNLIGDVLALSGDSVDNIPGVQGVGGKTARAILSVCPSVEELLLSPHLDDQFTFGHEEVGGDELAVDEIGIVGDAGVGGVGDELGLGTRHGRS